MLDAHTASEFTWQYCLILEVFNGVDGLRRHHGEHDLNEAATTRVYVAKNVTEDITSQNTHTHTSNNLVKECAEKQRTRNAACIIARRICQNNTLPPCNDLRFCYWQADEVTPHRATGKANKYTLEDDKDQCCNRQIKSSSNMCQAWLSFALSPNSSNQLGTMSSPAWHRTESYDLEAPVCQRGKRTLHYKM